MMNVANHRSNDGGDGKDDRFNTMSVRPEERKVTQHSHLPRRFMMVF